MTKSTPQIGSILFCLLLLNLLTGPVWAQTRIAILDFELNDLTLLPTTTEEADRTRIIKPLLETRLEAAGHRIVHIPAEQQQQANQGFGYLFDHPDVAAKLGRSHSVDYVLVGKLHKPSFLFAYLMCHLVSVKDANRVEVFIQEAKGESLAMTKKAVDAVAERIHQTLSTQSRADPVRPEHTD